MADGDFRCSLVFGVRYGDRPYVELRQGANTRPVERNATWEELLRYAAAFGPAAEEQVRTSIRLAAEEAVRRRDAERVRACQLAVDAEKAAQRAQDAVLLANRLAPVEEPEHV